MEWPVKLMAIPDPTIHALFVYELPGVYSLREMYGKYSSFLDCIITDDLKDIKIKFENCKCYKWLIRCLYENDGELYFGKLTALLHDALINDPKPYRKEVKILLQYLLNWVIELDIENLVIDRPNYSQRIKLILL